MVESCQQSSNNTAQKWRLPAGPGNSMNINAKEFTPSTFQLPVKPSYPILRPIITRSVADTFLESYELKKTSSGNSSSYWIYWSKNLFTNIINFFAPSEKIFKRLLLVSTRMRGAVLDSIPRLRLQIAETAPDNI